MYLCQQGQETVADRLLHYLGCAYRLSSEVLRQQPSEAAHLQGLVPDSPDAPCTFAPAVSGSQIKLHLSKVLYA